MIIKGLKKAAGVTRNVSYRHGGRVQISIDLSTGVIYTDYHVGENWSVYHDSAIKTVCFAYGPMTMQEIEYYVDRLIEMEWEDMNS